MKQFVTSQKMAIAYLLFFITGLLRGLFINSTPNSFSVNEMTILSKLHIMWPIGNYEVRLAFTFFSFLLSVALFRLILRVTKSYSCSMISVLAISLSPWFFILSRHVNVYIIFNLLLIVILDLFYLKTTLKVACLIGLFVLIAPFMGNYSLGNTLTNLSDSYVALIKTLDFRTLFFTGDFLSIYLRTPQTGFFITFDLITLSVGLYSLCFIEDQYKKLRDLIFELLIVSVIYFFIATDQLITYRASLIFIVLGLIIGFGYLKIAQTIIQKKYKMLLISIFLMIYGLNFLYFQELFYRHFNKENSFEWGYAEDQIISKIANNPRIKKVYFTSEGGKINKYLEYYRIQHLTGEQISSTDVPTLCTQQNAVCVLLDHEQSYLPSTPYSKTRILYSNGLTAYYLITKDASL